VPAGGLAARVAAGGPREEEALASSSTPGRPRRGGVLLRDLLIRPLHLHLRAVAGSSGRGRGEAAPGASAPARETWPQDLVAGGAPTPAMGIAHREDGGDLRLVRGRARAVRWAVDLRPVRGRGQRGARPVRGRILLVECAVCLAELQDERWKRQKGRRTN
jgi:hypothetical protein